MGLIPVYFGVLVIASFLCHYRIGHGPTVPDRAVGIDILGVVVVGFSALLTLSTGQEFYLSVGLTWILLNFIGTLALAKFLEGRGFDE
jgi:multicomponent Na+:H+ antiporter subunit F